MGGKEGRALQQTWPCCYLEQSHDRVQRPENSSGAGPSSRLSLSLGRQGGLRGFLFRPDF